MQSSDLNQCMKGYALALLGAALFALLCFLLGVGTGYTSAKKLSQEYCQNQIVQNALLYRKLHACSAALGSCIATRGKHNFRHYMTKGADNGTRGK